MPHEKLNVSHDKEPKADQKEQTVPQRSVQKRPAGTLSDTSEKQEMSDIADRIANEKEPKPNFLDQFPEGQNIVGGDAVHFMLGKVPHTFQCSDKGIKIDGVDYKFIAVGASPFGGDVNLSLYEVSRAGDILTFRAGAYFKEGTVQGNSEKTKAIIETLVNNGKHEQKTKAGKLIRIEKA